MCWRALLRLSWDVEAEIETANFGARSPPLIVPQGLRFAITKYYTSVAWYICAFAGILPVVLLADE